MKGDEGSQAPGTACWFSLIVLSWSHAKCENSRDAQAKTQYKGLPRSLISKEAVAMVTRMA